ncbi:MAG: glycoside hydrolase family 2 TIM barrel-domain containing protein [Thermoguttaceae bacterium]
MIRFALGCGTVALVLAALATEARAEGGRKVVSLDGTWQIAEGPMSQRPKAFDHQVPVPGLADMAVPAFADVGVKDTDPRREAFWYRREFTLPGPVPAVAQLKIHKACYGTRAWLNGQPLGEHLGCFTPGYFDVAKPLRGNGQPNELVVRVAASHTALPPSVPWGHDFEKIRYIPGIYDSVELILSGSPHVVRMQAIPDVPGKKLGVAAVLEGAGATAEGAVRLTVREATTHKIVGTAESAKRSWKPGEPQTIQLSTPIENCRLWSPEDPFLYEVEVSTAGDTLVTRFGMRSFAFDPASKRAVLNGRPYYLRGTNICIYRFFEDPLRGDKPWREDWVRRVIRAFRSMHWNSCRYCIGFPPELWYRIADEEGLMIQDEFPVWGQTGDVPTLTGQYREWMQERWNHPSVVIWDGQNETPNQEVTGKAINAVRSLDLSHRPWDNGWASPGEPTDVYEAHPYRHINAKFRMSEFARMSPKPGDPGSWPGNPMPNRGDNPIIINEYGWLWLNRDGTPCTLPIRDRSYEHLLPPNTPHPTPDQYREAYARTLAAKTEFWRCGRKVAGVLHFCGLGYSRPGGQTSDNFITLDPPTLEPHFRDYVGDAFAPVGLMLDFWADEVPAGTTLNVPVVVINDTGRDWEGVVDMRLHPSATTGCGFLIGERRIKVPALGREVLTFDVKVRDDLGECWLAAGLRWVDHKLVRSGRGFRVPGSKAPAGK